MAVPFSGYVLCPHHAKYHTFFSFGSLKGDGAELATNLYWHSFNQGCSLIEGFALVEARISFSPPLLGFVYWKAKNMR